MQYWYTRHHAEDGIYWKLHKSEEACHQHAIDMFKPHYRVNPENPLAKESTLYIDTNYGRRMWVCHMTPIEYMNAVTEDKACYGNVEQD